jgi:hypothetical protein
MEMVRVRALIANSIRSLFRVGLLVWSAGMLFVAGLFWRTGAFYVTWAKNPPRGALIFASSHPIAFFGTLATIIALAIAGFLFAILLPKSRR